MISTGRGTGTCQFRCVAEQLRAHLVSAADGAIYAILMAGDATVPEEWTQRLYRLADDGSAWVPLAGLDSPIPKRKDLGGADEQGLILLDRRSLGLCHRPFGESPDRSSGL